MDFMTPVALSIVAIAAIVSNASFFVDNAK